MNTRKRADTQRGATLIEAMATLGVFTIGFLGLFQMNAIASLQNGFANRQSAAGLIARDMIDTFERLPYTHPALAISTTAYSYSTNWGAGASPLSGAAGAIIKYDGYIATDSSSPMNVRSLYSVKWTVSALKDSSDIEIGKRIRIDVQFNPFGSKTATESSKWKTETFFTAKYNPTVMVGTATNFQEI